jgi:hypothetical protein
VVLAFEFTMPGINKETSFEITETLVFDYHTDNYDGEEFNDEYADLRNRLNLKLAVDNYTFSMRLDTITLFFPDDTMADDIDQMNDPPYLDRYAPEKYSAQYRDGTLQLDLGDFYASFGRGIALRIRKTDELAEDTSLQGIKARVNFGPFKITGLGGVINPTNTDGVTEKIIEDVYDLITGLQASYRIEDRVVWGVHGVGVFFNALDQNRVVDEQIEMGRLPNDALIFGTSVEVPDLFDYGDAYAEFNYTTQSFDVEDIPYATGWAAYFGSNLYLGDFTVTPEFKAYSTYDLHTMTDRHRGDDDDVRYFSQRLDYIRPPTLEPEDMEIHNNDDITGGRLRVDWRPGGGDTLVFLSYAGFVATDKGDVGDRFIYNAQIGAEQDFMKRGRVGLDIGLREENPDYDGGHPHHLLYINANLKVPILIRHSVDLHVTHWFVHEYATKKEFIKGTSSLDYSWSPYLSVGVILGYDTYKSTRSFSDIEEFFVPDPEFDPDRKFREIFLAGNLTVNLSSRVVFKLLVGQIRGGLLCVSGACREYPSFSGVRFTTVVRL